MKRVSRPLLPALAILALLAGCSNADSPADGKAGNATPSGSPTASAPSASATDAAVSQSELDEAIAALPSQSNFTLTYSIRNPKPIIDTRGTYYASNGKRWEAMSDILSLKTGKVATMTTIANGPKMWLQMDSWVFPDNMCWLKVPQTNLPVGMRFMSRPTPMPYLVLDELTSTPDGYTAPFGLAVQLLTYATTQQTGWDAHLDSTEPVPVTVEFEEGLVSRIVVSGADLLETVPPVPGKGRGEAKSIADVTIDMTFADAIDYNAEPPLPQLVVTPNDDGCV